MPFHIIAQSTFEHTITISIPLAALTYLGGIITKDIMFRRKTGSWSISSNGKNGSSQQQFKGDVFSRDECERRHELDRQERKAMEERFTNRMIDTDGILNRIENKQDRLLTQIDDLYEKLRKEQG